MAAGLAYGHDQSARRRPSVPWGTAVVQPAPGAKEGAMGLRSGGERQRLATTVSENLVFGWVARVALNLGSGSRVGVRGGTAIASNVAGHKVDDSWVTVTIGRLLDAY